MSDLLLAMRARVLFHAYMDRTTHSTLHMTPRGPQSNTFASLNTENGRQGLIIQEGRGTQVKAIKGRIDNKTQVEHLEMKKWREQKQEVKVQKYTSRWGFQNKTGCPKTDRMCLSCYFNVNNQFHYFHTCFWLTWNIENFLLRMLFIRNKTLFDRESRFQPLPLLLFEGSLGDHSFAVQSGERSWRSRLVQWVIVLLDSLLARQRSGLHYF